MSGYLFECKSCGKRTAVSIEELDDVEDDGYVCNSCGARHRIEISLSIDEWKDEA